MMKTVFVLLLLSACAVAQIPGINHIVIITSENQSADRLGPLMPSGFDFVSVGQSKTLGTVALTHSADPPLDNPGHGYAQAVSDIDGGKMDGFAAFAQTVNGVNQAYTQLYCTDLPWLCDLANNQVAGMPTVTADAFFEAEHDPSWGAHEFLVAATDANVIGIPSNNNYWGCNAPAGTRVTYKDPVTHKNSLIFPCVTQPTIADTADAAGVSLAYYGPLAGDQGYHFVAPTYNRNWLFGADASYIKNVSQFPADVAAGNLAQITYLVPPMASSGHPPYSMHENEAWIETNLQALAAGPEWPSTAVFVFWDDWGGWYDHAVPPAGDGLRVPLIVVSPLIATPGAVWHSVADFGSLLLFIDQQFGLACLTAKDCGAASISGMFVQ
jgi:phospholipase C